MSEANSFAFFFKDPEEAEKLGEAFPNTQLTYIHQQNFSAVVIPKWDMPTPQPKGATGFPQCFTALANSIANGHISPPSETDGS